MISEEGYETTDNAVIYQKDQVAFYKQQLERDYYPDVARWLGIASHALSSE